MMKLSTYAIALLTMLASQIPSAHANSVNDASKGSKQILMGSGKLASGSVKAAASSVAIPLVVVGSVGAASLDAGTGLIEFATDDDTPLPIGEETIIASPPPQEALQQQSDSDKQQGI